MSRELPTVNTPLERDLDALVRSYVPEGDGRSHELALTLLGSDRPMWPRSEFKPGHFTASAFVLFPERDALLMIYHRKLVRWLQPGGHIESGDASIEDAARREVFEETGVGDLRLVGSAPLRIDAHEIPHHGREPSHVHIDLGIGFLAVNPAIGPIAEVIDARWVPIDELETYDIDDALRAGALAVRAAAE